MTFGEKLKKLRTDSALNQDELAEKIYVTRTAISKWESNRGYPNIDSLKAISKFFSVSIDELLYSDEVLMIAEEDNKQKETRFKDLVFALLDLSVAKLDLSQWVERKSFLKVDLSILALGGFYFVVMAMYFLFEIVVINYRPVLILFMVIGRLVSGVHWITDIIGGALVSCGLVTTYASVSDITK